MGNKIDKDTTYLRVLSPYRKIIKMNLNMNGVKF